MAKRSPYSSGKALKKQRNERMLKYGVGGSLAFVFLIGTALLLRLDAITISRIQFRGLSVLSENDVRPLVEQELAGAYAFFIPKQSTLFYPAGGIEKDIKNAFKRVKEVEVSRDSLTGIVVSVEERKPDAQWCREDKCYFIDESGYIFAEAPNYTGDVYIRFEGSVADDNPVGTQYLSPEEFRTLNLFIISMEQAGYKTVSLSLVEDEFSLGLPGGGKVIFVRGTSLDEIVRAAQAAKQSEAFSEKSLDQLEYLDLRFPNKAVYKWK